MSLQDAEALTPVPTDGTLFWSKVSADQGQMRSPGWALRRVTRVLVRRDQDADTRRDDQMTTEDTGRTRPSTGTSVSAVEAAVCGALFQQPQGSEAACLPVRGLHCVVTGGCLCYSDWSTRPGLLGTGWGRCGLWAFERPPACSSCYLFPFYAS